MCTVDISSVRGCFKIIKICPAIDVRVRPEEKLKDIGSNLLIDLIIKMQFSRAVSSKDLII